MATFLDGRVSFVRSSVVEDHDHLVFLNEETGVGQTSESRIDGHTHTARFQDAKPAVKDDSGATVTPATEAQWIMDPASNGHIHEVIGRDLELLDIVDTIPKDDRDEKTKVMQTKDFFFETLAAERRSRDWAEEARGLYQSDEDIYFDEGNKQKLQAESRPVIVVNEAESKIDALVGFQRQNRTDITSFPVERGDQRVTDVLNILIKNVTEQNKLPIKESLAFENAAIEGRGSVTTFLDFDSNPEEGGDIILKNDDPPKVSFGPHDEFDASDLEILCFNDWASLDSLVAEYPEKKKELEAQFQIISGNIKGDEIISIVKQNLRYDLSTEEINIFSSDKEVVNAARKEVRVIECWQKKFRKSNLIMNEDADIVVRAENWSDEDIEDIKTMTGFELGKYNTSYIRFTKIAGMVHLSDDRPLIGLEAFHTVPIYAKKNGRLFWGKIRSSAGLLRAVSKFFSQAVDIVNKMGGRGVLYDEETFDGVGAEEDFLANFGSPGVKIKVKDMNKSRPEILKGDPFPSDIVGIMTLASNKIRESMGIPLEFLGIQERETSGIALMRQIRQGLVGNEFLFDNLDIAKKRIGQLIIGMIQKHYTVRRIMRILENQNQRQLSDTKEEVSVRGVPFNQLDTTVDEGTGKSARADLEELLEDMLENGGLMKYDIVVSKSRFNETMQLALFQVLLEAAKQGIEIPVTEIIMQSPFPQDVKDRVIASIQARQQAAAQAEQQKVQAEIQKSLPDEVKVPQAQQQAGPQAQ